MKKPGKKVFKSVIFLIVLNICVIVSRSEDDEIVMSQVYSDKMPLPPPTIDRWGVRHFNIGVLLVSGTGSGFDLEKCSPAVDLALDYVNRVYLRHHRVILDKVQSSYPSCDNSLTPGLAADMRFMSNVLAFVGPACGFALEPVARLAAYWNIPVVTGLGDQPPSTESEVSGDRLLGHEFKINNTGVFGDKSKFPTLTRLSYCQCRLKNVFDSICTTFGWKHLAVVYDRTDLFSFTVGRILINGMKEIGYEVYGHDIDGRILEEMDDALSEIRAHARIVILSLQEILVREFMLKAHRKGLTSGEWAFLDVELFKNKPSETNYWQMGDEKSDLEAKAAYEALLTISLLIPKSPLWKNFTEQVKAKSLNDYNYTFPEDEEVNFFIGAFYDGVILLGMALNETLTRNTDITDGRSIALQMWNRTFQGVTGNVTIDENGDRNADYSILDMNPETGHFEVVAFYSSALGFNRMKDMKVRWPGGKGQPLDIPECGFLDNEPHCMRRREGSGFLPFASIIILIFILLILLILLYVYKHLREVEAASSTRWRVLPEELFFDTGESKSRTTVEERESSRGSLSIGNAGGQVATFCQTAIHRGSQIAIRKITLIKRVEFTKQIISEIRQVREMQHENVSRLVGLCLSSSDPKSNSDKWDNILILSEYSTRGSLRDVLLNAHIHLDWPFRLSLLSDIVNGLSYLHSNHGAHGRLSSAKCLVDSRFVVKISDFGLSTLHSYEKIDKTSLDYFIRLFWVAPELIFVSNGTYGTSGTLKEIVMRVESRRSPPTRPELSDSDSCPHDIHQLILQCWADSPEDRPSDFPSIKQTLKRLMKGAGTVSLVDDLLRRLEQHATHLESLVEDKTRELAQEKRRSEDLLYQVLPRQVAEQLLRGETVIPESFDAVTIYFSDIVSFTSICVKSTPMQVVDFLNNLYGTFDGILDSFDAYKVETIGDAYLVVSGCPQRNNESHVTEISYLSLAVLDAVKNFEIGHLPDEQLKIRIGIHTGPVCAGVVGHRMPHYCLFGDTVNTASRLESSGLPLKIHISQTTADALNKVGGFQIVPRGEVVLKGKGVTSTYWLEGSDDECGWRRVKPMTKGSSKESLDTKVSMNALVFSGSPSGLGGISLLGSLGNNSTVLSPISSSHHHHFSPNNNLTTISITPAD